MAVPHLHTITVATSAAGASTIAPKLLMLHRKEVAEDLGTLF